MNEQTISAILLYEVTPSNSDHEDFGKKHPVLINLTEEILKR